jgi:hypothetical protein
MAGCTPRRGGVYGRDPAPSPLAFLTMTFACRAHWPPFGRQAAPLPPNRPTSPSTRSGEKLREPSALKRCAPPAAGEAFATTT